MPESLLSLIERRLIALRLPTARRKRAIQELSEHREDLFQAALADGLSKSEAALYADRSLGDPIEVADQIVMATRQSSWWGRHPVISFCLLPFIGTLLAICVGFVVAFGSFYLVLSSKQWAIVAGGGPGFSSLQASMRWANVIVVALIAWVFCRMIVNSAIERKWLWIASGICSALAYLVHIYVTPHNLVVMLAVRPPVNWFCVVCATIPFVIAGTFLIRRRGHYA